MITSYAILIFTVYAAAAVIGAQLFHYARRWLLKNCPQWTKNLAYCIPLVTLSFASYAQTALEVVKSL